MKRIALSILLCLCGCVTASAQNSVTLTVADTRWYPTVRVPFRIIDNGALLTNVEPSRLRFLENGAETPFSVTCPVPKHPTASVAIGLERSLDNSFGTAKQAALDFLRTMHFTDVRNNASFWSFATPIDKVVDVVRDSARLYNAINAASAASLPFNGTPLYETMHRAIEDIVEYGTEPNRVVIFFTDGNNNTSYFSRSRDDVIGRAKVDGVRVYVVAIGNNAAAQSEMQTICQQTGGLFARVSDPGVYNLIYSDMLRVSANDYWCTLEFESLLCPNGSARQLALEYTSPQSGIFGESIGYIAPYEPDKLSKFTFGVSPWRMSFQQDDTIQIACGTLMQQPVLVAGITLELTHPGLRAIYAGLPDGLDDWTLKSSMVPSYTTLEFQPPPHFVPPAGAFRWAVVTLVAERRGESELSLSMKNDETQCLVLDAFGFVNTHILQMDTVATSWHGLAHAPVRFSGGIPMEGVQNVSFEIEYNAEALSLDTSDPESVQLPEDWRLFSLSRETTGNTATVNIGVRGPALGSSGFCTLAFRVQEGAGYFNPITITAASVNDFNTIQDVRMNPGMIVVRDSCRNNIAVLQQGLAVRYPSPNPASASASFTLSAIYPEHVDIGVFNALGVECRNSAAIEVPAGKTVWTLATSEMEEGLYFIRFRSRTGQITHLLHVRR